MALLIIPVLKGDRELEVRTATCGPGIDQSQRAKSVSHIIKKVTSLQAIKCLLNCARSESACSSLLEDKNQLI